MCITRRPTAALVRSGMLFGLAALLPSVAIGQQSSAPARVREPQEIRNNARADTVEARAEALYGMMREWRTAAQLQRRAGDIRGNDPRAIENYRMAAWLYSSDNALGLARKMMERAGEMATKVGDLELAAVSYLDAADIAIAAEHLDALPGLVRKTWVLLDAPLFPAARRAQLLERIGHASQLAAVWESPN